MRKIEVPDADTMAEWFDKRPSNDFSEESPYLNYCHGIIDIIAYANTQLQTVQEHKRPFLSDEDIDDYSNGFEFTAGSKWARDRYEEMLSASSDETVEEWKPPLDAWVCGWNGPGGKAESVLFHASETGFGKYAGAYPGNLNRHLITINGMNFAYDHVALIDNLDEIGKPPSYFMQRGRCTVNG